MEKTETFKVGDKVACELGGKTRYQRIRSFVPSIEGGGVSNNHCRRKRVCCKH